MGLSKESLVGSLVEGRYLIEDELGVGGMSAVYLARDLKVHGRGVVVKVLLAEMFQNEYVVKKFRQEAEALSRLEHPNVVTIYDYGEMPGGEPYLVLQFIDGGSLRPLIRPGGVELGRAARIVRQVSNALTAAHDKGILHRDLKPDNVMLQALDGEERVVVIDFGIAQVQDSVIAPKTVVTAAAGTMYYMSPEQLTAGALTPASDTYALGVIAYELVTGEKPFTPKSPFQLLEMQRAGVAVTPRQLRPELPAAAEAAILRALSFDAAARHQRTCELGQELQRALTGEPHAASPTATPTAAPGNAAAQLSAPGESPPSAAEQSAPPSALVTEGPFDPTQAYVTQPLPTGQGRRQDEQQPQPTRQQTAQQQQQSSPPASSASSSSVAPAPAGEASKPRRLAPAALIVGAVVLLVAGAAGFVGWKMMQAGTATAPSGRAGESAANASANVAASAPAPQAEAPAAAAPEQLTLNYSLTVQRMRDGKEYREPFESTGREIFEGGWSFRVNLSTPKAGYLYLVNEGRDEAGALGYTVLYPTVGDARLDAGQRVQLPSGKDYFFFTGEPGTEKIWVVWSEQPVAEMEALRQFANPTDQGEVGDPAQVTNLRQFFAAHASPPAEVVEDKANKQTTVRSAGPLLVHLAELEHH